MIRTNINIDIVRFVFYMILLSCICTNVYSQVTCIDRVDQEEENWCWAASCEMALECFGVEWPQSDIADWAVYGEDIGNSFVGSSPGAKHNISEVYSEKVIVHTHKEYTITPWDVEPHLSDIKEEVNNNNRPVHVGLDGTPTCHSIIITGVVYDNLGDLDHYICVDPGPDNDTEIGFPRYYMVKHAIYFDAEIGVLDGIQLSNDAGYNPDYVSQNENIYLKARFLDSGDESWISYCEWSIYFMYNGGYYNYVTNENSYNTDPNTQIINWSTTIPSTLPGDKYWKGVEIGEDTYIKGKIHVRIKDSDDCWHSDSKTVWFKNPGVDLIPWNISYTDETLHSNQGIVLKAKNKITIDNVTFKPNSSGSFISGNKIDIAPNTNYLSAENNSRLNFEIDPSIQ